MIPHSHFMLIPCNNLIEEFREFCAGTNDDMVELIQDAIQYFLGAVEVGMLTSALSEPHAVAIFATGEDLSFAKLKYGGDPTLDDSIIKSFQERDI